MFQNMANCKNGNIFYSMVCAVLCCAAVDCMSSVNVFCDVWFVHALKNCFVFFFSSYSCSFEFAVIYYSNVLWDNVI